MSNDELKPEDPKREELRRRMVRELEEFLSKAINRPFPRLRLKASPAPRNRYTLSLN